MAAYEEIQRFFSLAYDLFNDAAFSASAQLKQDFCTMGALDELSNVGKIIINLDDFCEV